MMKIYQSRKRTKIYAIRSQEQLHSHREMSKGISQLQAGEDVETEGHGSVNSLLWLGMEWGSNMTFPCNMHASKEIKTFSFL